jgi:membrane-bound lytic murein transglycosylase D
MPQFSGISCLVLVTSSLLLISCTNGYQVRTERDSFTPSTVEITDPKDVEVGEELEKSSLNKPGEKIPIEINHHVNKWISYFQGRGRKHMNRYLTRSGRYIPMMKDILREENLPEDLVYIALIESGFSSSAHSHANAVGYWQFIRGTGKSYGLEINGMVDERRDAVLSTYAAAQYFKSLYNLFGDWYLAIASYNVGENRVKRLVMKHQTRDFWTLVRKRGLPRETRDYVPKFLAATIIAKNPERYGFADIEFAEPLKYAKVESTRPLDLGKLARNMGVSYSEIKLLNPQFRTEYAPVRDNKVVVKVPFEAKDKAIEVLAESTYVQTRKIADLERDYFYYRVLRGDTLSGIARRFRTRVTTLQKLNSMQRKTMLRVGRRIKVPVNNERAYSYMGDGKSSKVKPSKPGRVYAKNRKFFSGRRVHVVRSGDTLIRIARHYGTSLSQIAKLNNMGNRSKIFVGSKLVIPD